MSSFMTNAIPFIETLITNLQKISERAAKNQNYIETICKTCETTYKCGAGLALISTVGLVSTIGVSTLGISLGAGMVVIGVAGSNGASYYSKTDYENMLNEIKTEFKTLFSNLHYLPNTDASLVEKLKKINQKILDSFNTNLEELIAIAINSIRELLQSSSNYKVIDLPEN